MRTKILRENLIDGKLLGEVEQKGFEVIRPAIEENTVLRREDGTFFNNGIVFVPRDLSEPCGPKDTESIKEVYVPTFTITVGVEEEAVDTDESSRYVEQHLLENIDRLQKAADEAGTSPERKVLFVKTDTGLMDDPRAGGFGWVEVGLVIV